MKVKIKKILIALSLIAAVFAVAHFALAATVDPGLNYAAGTGLSADSDPRVIAANIIRIALGFLGIVAVGLIIYAGWLYMTANGEAEKAEKAKKILIGAIIGLLICLASFAIASYILSRLTEATGGSDTGDGTVCTQSCGDGQHCCASVCVPSATSCGGGGPDAFAISATIPRDQATDVIRNVMVKVYFNRAIADTVSQDILNNNLKVEKIATIDPAGGAETALAEAQAVGGAVLLSDSRQEINFRSSAPCGDEKDTKYCFESWSKYKISLNGGSGIISINNQSLSCSAGAKCEFVFSTNNLIDTSGPTAGITPTQICKDDDGELASMPDANLVNGWANDDAGVSDIRFCSQKQGEAENCFANSVKTGGLGQTNLRHSYKYDTSLYPVGADYIFKVKASDAAGQLDQAEFPAKIRPGHCCNGVKDPGETETDCGGDCGACDGAACANDISVPATCNDNLCASQTCRPVSDSTTTANNKCVKAGYADGTTNCCLCQRPPVITSISPAGGFCKIDSDKACLKDSDCASGDSCDTEIPNGKAGNFFTIYGRNFGASPGLAGGVYASSTSSWVLAKLANDLADGNDKCTNIWTDNKITAIVPNGAITGAIKVVKSDSASTTSDKNGVLDFKINNIDRPGICQLDPDSGKQDQIINYYGVKLSGFSPYFGNINNNVAGVRPSFNDNKTGTAAVPNITTGQTSSFVLKDKVYSNYLDFTKERELYKGPFITSFDPKEGAAGQYVTINGNGFGTTTGAVFFGDMADNKPASFEFPEKCQKSIWSDKQVIVKVPNDLTNGNYKITMKIGSWPAIDTSSIRPAIDFKFDSSLPLKPGLCLIDPLTGNINTRVSLYGEYFGNKTPLVLIDNKTYPLIRFQANKDQSGDNISSWAKDNDPKITGIQADKITTNVPDKAVTGPVKVVQTKAVQGVVKELIGNGMIFNVGVCKIKDDCGSGSLCCSAGTPYAGQCKTGTDKQTACFSEVKSCVYEWNFSTAGSCGYGQTSCGSSCCNSGQTCEADGNNGNGRCDSIDCPDGVTCGTCCHGATACAAGGVCPGQCEAGQTSCLASSAAAGTSPACCNPGQQCNTATGACGSCPANKPTQCVGDGACCSTGGCKDTDNNPATPTVCTDPESCSGYGSSLTSCYGQICPNSPGQCSASPAKPVDTGVQCSDDACKILTGCKDKDGNNLCTYSTALNKCKKTSSVCDLTKVKEVSDAAGNKFDLKCGIVDNKSVWYYDSNQTCAASGYTKSIDKTKCLGAACNTCSTGFVCQQSGNGGVCAVDKTICPAGSSCDIVSKKCVKNQAASCDCCCDISKNTGSSNPGCCSGLTCGDSCGSDTSLTDGPNGANVGQGLCTGCTVRDANGQVNQAASNASCNCTGTSGKFCDTAGAGGLGTCKDCTQLSTGGLCSGLGAGSCCVDNAKSNACRGVSAGGGTVEEAVTRESYSENFDKDGELAGWKPEGCEANYSVKDEHFIYHAAFTNPCPFNIKYNYKFFSGDSYKITIKDQTDLDGYKYIAKLRDGVASTTREAEIPKYGIVDQEYVFDFNDLARDFNQLEFYQTNQAGEIKSFSNWYTNVNNNNNVDYIKITEKTDYTFCAYYSCGAGGYADQCQGAQKTGTYRTKDCGSQCVTKPQFGETCFKVSTSTKNQICDESICKNFSCLNENGDGPTPPNSCGTCCCDPKNDNCASLNSAGKPLKCQTDKGSCSGDNRGLCCGCSRDDECGGGGVTNGCGTDACCDGRPSVTSTVPANGAGNDNDSNKVCRNSLIQADFDRPMSINTFSGNVIVAADYGAEQCPADTTYLTAAYKPTFFAKIKFWLAKLPLINKLFADAARADAAGNFCAIKGTVNGINNADKTATLEFAPAQVLEPSRKYYVIIKGDTDITDAVKQGVLSQSGIGLKPVAADEKTFNGVAYQGKIWSFTTLPEQAVNSGVCKIAYAEITPASRLFQTNKNDVSDDALANKFDTINDSDLVYTVEARAKDGTALNSLTDIYSWTWTWTSGSPKIFELPSVAELPSDNQLVRASATATEGKSVITAVAAVSGAQAAGGESYSASADAYLMVCSNPWPAVKSDGTWEPWRDFGLKCSAADGNCDGLYDKEGDLCGTNGHCQYNNCTTQSAYCSNTNFELYYCRDAGGPGTADDLPVIQSDSAVIRGRNLVCSDPKGTCGGNSKEKDLCGSGKCQVDILKEFYFFRESKPLTSGGFSSVSALPPGGGVAASWNAVTSVPPDPPVTGYKIYYGTASGNYTDSIDAGNATSKEISGLTNGKTYYFALTSYNAQKAKSGYSDPVSVTPRDIMGPAVAPALFKATPKNKQAELEWANNYSEAVSFRVFYKATDTCDDKVNFGSSIPVVASTAATSTALVSNLANGIKYCFGAVAYDSSGNASATSTVSAIPFAPAKNLSLVGIGDGAVKLSWDSAVGAAKYKVYYNQDGNIFNDFVATSTIGTAANPQIISQLTNGTAYYFVVKSINADNMENADYSNKVSAVPKNK